MKLAACYVIFIKLQLNVEYLLCMFTEVYMVVEIWRNIHIMKNIFRKRYDY